MRSTMLIILPVLALTFAGCSETPVAPASTDTSVQTAPQVASMPSTDSTIYDIAKAASEGTTPEFTILVAALEATGLDAALDGMGQFTVFAPTDAAFARLFANPAFPYTPSELLAETELLSSVLLYHVARGNRVAEDVVSSDKIRMMSKGFNEVLVNGMGAYLVDTSSLTSNARIVAVDIPASNGVIHVIDEVLLP